jgi:hypothetical protein
MWSILKSETKRTFPWWQTFFDLYSFAGHRAALNRSLQSTHAAYSKGRHVASKQRGDETQRASEHQKTHGAEAQK